MRCGIRVALVVAIACITKASAQAPTGPDISVSVNRCLPYLQQKTLAWKEKMGCASCHHAPMMLWACYAAKEKGFAVDEQAVKIVHDWLVADDNSAKMLPAKEVPINQTRFALVAAYALLALDAGPATPADGAAIKRLREILVGQQHSDGAWGFVPEQGRAPILEGVAVYTRMARLALVTSPNVPDGADAIPAVIQKADPWLASNQNTSEQIQVLQLLIAVRQNAPAEVVRPQVSALFALQRPNGSWAQTPEMAGDAFATGQTLYALGKAGERSDTPAIARAVSFLLKTQNQDGSWAMTSRPTEPGQAPPHSLEPIMVEGSAFAVLGMLAVS